MFTLVATDNGGLSSSAAGHSIDVKLDLPKKLPSFLWFKEIDVGDFSILILVKLRENILISR